MSAHDEVVARRQAQLAKGVFWRVQSRAYLVAVIAAVVSIGLLATGWWALGVIGLFLIGIFSVVMAVVSHRLKSYWKGRRDYAAVLARISALEDENERLDEQLAALDINRGQL